MRRRVRTEEQVVRRLAEYRFIPAMLEGSHAGAVVEDTRAAAREVCSGQIMVLDPRFELETTRISAMHRAHSGLCLAR